MAAGDTDPSASPDSLVADGAPSAAAVGPGGADNEPLGPPPDELAQPTMANANTDAANSHAFGSRTCSSRTFDSRTFDSRTFDSPTFDSPTFGSRAFDSHAFGSHAFGSRTCSSRPVGWCAAGFSLRRPDVGVCRCVFTSGT
ncbi:unannotated protein [freshwater metagenome]|uniref:Unannotated protein n=1 Tax=freshwater metagenome TaxID=449393 RepID=A0A6J7ENU3_9ZZZZ